MELILASASPRRRELLAQIGVPCQILPVDIDETPYPDENPAAYVERLALAKAQACLAGVDDEVAVLGSDTTVVLDDRVLGKPADEQDALATLMQLSGRVHQVVTAVAVMSRKRSIVKVVSTDVHFRKLTIDECHDYWRSMEPQDKAGSYGIQGLGAVFVDRIEGSYSAVVGLPLAETAQILKEFSVPVWQQVNS